MGLIASPRHSQADLDAWAARERHDALRCMTGRASMDRMEAQAMQHIRDFFAADPSGYVGTSWGKDSTVVAHLARRVDPSLPVVWCRLDRYDNPDCEPVRDAFLAAYPGRYHEYTAPGPLPVDGSLPTGARRPSYALAAAAHGDRYVSGIRGEESRARRLRQRGHGANSKRTSAPITTWTAKDVFAYLHRYDLPVHPAYAQSMGGRLDRDWLRVASLGGLRGIGHGRRRWEWDYYPDEMAALGITGEGR